MRVAHEHIALGTAGGEIFEILDASILKNGLNLSFDVVIFVLNVYLNSITFGFEFVKKQQGADRASNFNRNSVFFAFHGKTSRSQVTTVPESAI